MRLHCYEDLADVRNSPKRRSYSCFIGDAKLQRTRGSSTTPNDVMNDTVLVLSVSISSDFLSLIRPLLLNAKPQVEVIRDFQDIPDSPALVVVVYAVGYDTFFV